MIDPYRVLNVPRTADQATIKRAYRRLAKTLHPDRNPGDVRAEARFKEITQAYDLLSDPAKRARFDRGEIDAEGRPRAPFGFGGFGGGPGGAGGFAGQREARTAAESFFEKVFGMGFGRGPGATTRPGAASGNWWGDQSATRRRGADRRYRLEIDFLTAARGGRQRLLLDDGRTIEVEVPAGVETGKMLRLKGQGQPDPLGAPPGDALVELVVRPHPRFSREGHDIHFECPISLSEAVLGARITVPTIDGPVRLTVPPRANSGRRLRLRGKGLPGPGGARGDQIVRLVVILPEPLEGQLARDLERWARAHNYDVRGDLEEA